MSDSIHCPKCNSVVEEGSTPGVLHCPNCGHCFPAPETEALAGPEKIDLTPEQRRESIRRIAKGIVTLAAILLGIGAMVAFITVFSETPSVAGYTSAGVLVSISFWVYLLGQIVHIRANTEK